MEEQKNHLLPSNYVTILQLKQRWLEEKERQQRGSEKPEELNRDQRQEIQPEEIRSMENLNLHARNRPQIRNLASVKNQGTAEDSREKEDQLVVDVKLDVPPDKGSESKADDHGLALEKRRQKNKNKKMKKKNHRTTVLDEKNPKSEGEPTQDQNCEVERKHRDRLPEINGKKLRGGGRNTDEKKEKEVEHSPNSVNVDRIWEIGSKSRNSSIHDEIKTEEDRFTKHSNRFRGGYRDARANERFNSRNVQKEKGEALVWVRKGEVSSEISHGFHSK